ncbi:6-phosphofructokinase [Salibacterium sp. K-3]
MQAAVVNMSALPQSFLHFFARHLETEAGGWNMVIPGRRHPQWRSFHPEEFARTAPFSTDPDTYRTLAETLQDAEMTLLLTDPLQQEQELEQLLSSITSPVFIMPVSILYPSVRHSEAVGYDTALNEIVDQALSVADTADSMKYGTPRLFFLQLPEGASLHLAQDTALSTGGLEIHQTDESSIQQFCFNLESHFQNGHTFALAVTEETVELEHITRALPDSSGLNINVVTLDSAQCLGPHFTAKDRLLMVRAARKANEWKQSALTSGSRVEWFHVTA